MVNSAINGGIIPAVYKKFQSRKPLSDGSRPWYVVKILTPDRCDDVLNLFVNNFINEEPICKYSNLNSCPASVDYFKAYWKSIILSNTALVCYLYDDTHEVADAKPKIVGANLTLIQRKGDQEPTCSAPIWVKLLNSMHLLNSKCNVYEKYNVDTYLSAFGLYTLPEYRRQGIGRELLSARIPLCKILGLRLTVTVFTATASQILATKCGFEMLAEIPYAEFEKVHGIRFPGITSKSMKLMALEIE